MIHRIKRFSAYLIIIIIGVLSLVGCSAEDLEIKPEIPQSPIEYSGKKVTKYFAFSLSMVNGAPSRADSFVFEDGDQDRESKVSNLLILFYDADGRCVGYFDSDSFEKDNVSESGIEKIGWETLITVPVEVYEEVKDKDIDSFFAIVNYDDIKGEYIKETGNDGNETTLIGRDDLLNVDTDKLEVEGKGFVMTTPGHYDISGNYLHYWKISDDGSTKKGSQIIFNSKNEAAAHPVTVYVERLAARIELSKIENIVGVEVLYGTDVYKLTFTPIAWGLEGMEKTEYLSKHAPAKTSYDTNYPAGFYVWLNYTDSHRCFWAESPVYGNGSNVYPATGSETGTFALKYLTIENIDLNEDEFKEKTYKGYTYTTERTFSASELKNIDNPYAVPTSFVLKGKYDGAKWVGTDEKSGDDIEIEHHDGSTVTGNPAPTTDKDLSFKDSGFYLRDIDMERTDKETKDTDGNPASKRYQYRLYRENNGATSGPTDDLLIGLTKEQHVIFVKSEETFTYLNENGDPQNRPTTKYLPVKETTTYSTVEEDENQNVVNKTYTIKAEYIFKIDNTKRYWTGSGKNWISTSNTFTLQLKDDYAFPENIPVPQLYYAVYDENNGTAEYFPITAEADKTTANEELQKQLGYARKYYKGMAFFFSPITHYTGDYAPFGDSTNPYKGLFNYETETKDGKISYKKDANGRYIPSHKTGDFGVVRNHKYNFSISGISSLGYGVPDEGVIPLPEPTIEKDIYLFDIELKILPWNQFEYTLDI